MKNKNKNKLDEKAESGKFILSEQVQSKPPIDKKKTANGKEKSKEQKVKKGEFRQRNMNSCIRCILKYFLHLVCSRYLIAKLLYFLVFYVTLLSDK